MVSFVQQGSQNLLRPSGATFRIGGDPYIARVKLNRFKTVQLRFSYKPEKRETVDLMHVMDRLVFFISRLSHSSSKRLFSSGWNKGGMGSNAY